MPYRVKFLKGDSELGSNSWPTKEKAIAHAKDHFAARKTQMGATSVIVIDEDSGMIVLNWTGGADTERT